MSSSGSLTNLPHSGSHVTQRGGSREGPFHLLYLGLDGAIHTDNLGLERGNSHGQFGARGGHSHGQFGDREGHSHGQLWQVGHSHG